MVDDQTVKEILYEYINITTERKIQELLVKGKSSQLINEVLAYCLPKISKSKRENEDIISLGEGLIHYLLTTTLIPSQRKLEFGQMPIDIVIPDQKTLNTNPENAIVIEFPKTENKKTIMMQIEKVKQYQPINENLWIVLRKDLGIKHKTYEITEKKSFTEIFEDILKFQSKNRQTKLKIFKI